MAGAAAAANCHRHRGGALHTLKHTTTLFLNSHRVILPFVASALLALLALLLASHSYATLLLQRMVVALRLVTTLGPNSPRFEPLAAVMLEDTKRFFAVEAASTALAFVVSWLFMVAVVNVLAAAYSGQELSLRDVLAKFGLSWKRTLVTELMTTALRLCYSALFLTLLSLAAFTLNGSLPLVASTTVLCLISTVRIESMLHLSSTVSVLEKEHGGFSALRRAVELTGGREWEAFGLSLVLLPAGMVVFAGLYVVKGEGVWFGVAETCACVALAALVFGAWVVFYRGCLERRGKAVGLEGNSKKLGVQDVNLLDGDGTDLDGYV